MGNLCGKKADVVPAPQPSSQELEQNNAHLSKQSSKKDDGPQGYAVVQPAKANTTAELLGLKEENKIFVIEEKAIVEDAKKP